MKKTYVLDTNVLLHDPVALEHFKDNDVVVPITVIEEIDRFKREMSEKGRNARYVSRLIDSYRQMGNLSEGIEIAQGGSLRVAFCHAQTLEQLPPELHGGNGDNSILAVALEYKARCDCQVIVVTKDTNLRIKADAVGLLAEDYESDKVDIEELYSGAAEVLVSAEQLDVFHHKGSLTLEGEFVPNQCLTLVNAAKPSQTLLGRWQAVTQQVTPIKKPPRGGFWKVQPRNREQQFAVDLLLDPTIQVVTLVGKAGTGKTLFALAAGLYQVADERMYSRLLVARPVFPMGRDLGFLPGDVQEKLAPWMQPIFDNLELLLATPSSDRDRGPAKRGYEDLMTLDLLQVEPLTYIRGRSIPEQFMIVDEAQNLTPHEVKTILTRVGEGTKIVLTGDPYQIDNPYVDASSNGLTYVVERFKGQSISGHMTLMRGERSPLAELAANLL
jgi:PhoH-like ATPase